MARHTKEWNEGYQAAIEAIKKASENGQNGGQGGGLDGPWESPGGEPGGQGGQGGQGGIYTSGGYPGSKSGGSRTNPNDSSQGIVRPEDCSGQSNGIGDMPETPGGFLGKKDGDDLAKLEGYNKEGGDDRSVESDWKDSALREVKNMPNGSGWDALKRTIEGMYKVNTDWKKILHQVVGKAINVADTRRAYANKNILVSQDRIARTDKDKFDTMDYMIVFIDTSGSVTDKEVKLILAEVYSVALKKKPLKIYVMYCDTKIHHIDEYTNLRDLKKDATSTTRYGSGGTAFKPLWDILKEDKRFKRCKPDLIMIFTDGDDFSCRSGNDLTIERDKRTMNWLVWCIVDNPSVNLAKNESMTKIIHLSTNDIK